MSRNIIWLQNIFELEANLFIIKLVLHNQIIGSQFTENVWWIFKWMVVKVGRVYSVVTRRVFSIRLVVSPSSQVVEFLMLVFSRYYENGRTDDLSVC